MGGLRGEACGERGPTLRGDAGAGGETGELGRTAQWSRRWMAGAVRFVARAVGGGMRGRGVQRSGVGGEWSGAVKVNGWGGGATHLLVQATRRGSTGKSQRSRSHSNKKEWKERKGSGPIVRVVAAWLVFIQPSLNCSSHCSLCEQKQSFGPKRLPASRTMSFQCNQLYFAERLGSIAEAG